MAEIVPFGKPANDAEGRWATGDARCMKCKHEWVHCAPVGEIRFKCPSCELHFGVWMRAFGSSDGDTVFTCSCSSEYFFITKERGVQCAECGRECRPFD